jgi:hypothetical protein
LVDLLFSAQICTKLRMNGEWCCTCRQWLSPDAFRPNSNYTSGLDSWCRSCHAETVREGRAKNPDYFERYNAERVLSRRTRSRRGPCTVCGEPMTKRPDTLVCGDKCRRERKIRQRSALRNATEG